MKVETQQFGLCLTLGDILQSLDAFWSYQKVMLYDRYEVLDTLGISLGFARCMGLVMRPTYNNATHLPLSTLWRGLRTSTNCPNLRILSEAIGL